MRKLKLLVTASTFPRWEGDTEPRFILDYCKSIQKYFDVTVLAPMGIGAKERETIEGVNVIRYRYMPLQRFETLCYPGAIVPRIKEKKSRILQVPFLLFGLYRALHRNIDDYDVVHAHWIVPQGLLQALFNKPFIITGHGGDVFSFKKGIFRKLKEMALLKAKGITVVSKVLEEELLSQLEPKNKVFIEKTKILPMGVDDVFFSYRKSNSDIIRSLHDNSDVTIACSGRLVEIKGINYLIQAMKDVKGKLIIVGDGPQRQELQNQATYLKDKVIFVGSKTHEQLAKILAQADIYVLPSITPKDGSKEGLGLAALEAMAIGLPVIATSSGGIAEVIESGKNGILIEEKKPEQISREINRLIKSEELFYNIVKNGYITSDEYRYSKVASKYYDFIMKRISYFGDRT